MNEKIEFDKRLFERLMVAPLFRALLGKEMAETKEGEMLVKFIGILMNHGLSLEQTMDILREISELTKGD